ncbi:unnamed protein product [Owenia fusiformis]|uniref:Uncharacterized protein n=1 Tax=Owenia fusiformis TaxID=6347 RepID=A0A8J1U363_OWEFU|nr:unnamed protein product [Owenia fusiformis]
MIELEGTTDVLDGAYYQRENAINKCFTAARNEGLEYFALQDNGKCFGAPFGDTSYEMYGESEACDSNGMGGQWANDVYRITLEFVNMGCWKDSSTRTMTQLEGRAAILNGFYGNRGDAINKCFVAARNEGFEYFGVQHSGQCFGSAFGDTSYKKYGEKDNCDLNGEGGHWANNVYRIILGYRRVGDCFMSPHPGLDSVEGTDSTLDGNHTMRDDAIGKCYTVALDNGYPYFGLTDGGLCLAGSTYNNSATPLPIADCGVEGDGGPTSFLIYEIISGPTSTTATTQSATVRSNISSPMISTTASTNQLYSATVTYKYQRPKPRHFEPSEAKLAPMLGSVLTLMMVALIVLIVVLDSARLFRDTRFCYYNMKYGMRRLQNRTLLDDATSQEREETT